MDVKKSVSERYTAGAETRQPELCCPVQYNPELLAILPQEILDKDYGCGDPSAYVQPGDTVLDLGSGGGKICYMAAQIAGPNGQVIGVDMNDTMLALARKYQDEMTEKLDGHRVRFVKGHIQNLALDVAALESWLGQHPVNTFGELDALHVWQREQCRDRPLIADNSVDLVVSNCVLNLVSDEEKQQMIQEIYRVLKPGGRVAISDIISDEHSPLHLRNNPELWSGCISGAFQEQDFLQTFLDAGFHCPAYDKWDADPWQTVEGIEYRSATLTAIKPEGSDCLDSGQALIYRGPFSAVEDDDGHRFRRGERTAVCERTFRMLSELAPCRDDFIAITPAEPRETKTWCAPPGTLRPASETKGSQHQGPSCKVGGGCC